MKFTKMHGIGNDYVYVNCFEETVKDPAAVAKFVSDRHFGIGSDGLILIRPSEIADCEMDMYNLDGSQGAMCGNGIRCVAKFLFDNGMVQGNTATVETLSGIKKLKVYKQDGLVSRVRVDMGKAELNPKNIPVAMAKTKIINEPAFIDGVEYKITCVSMGNPHCVVFCDNIDSLDIEKVGPAFENSPLFPERVNAEFVKVVDSNTIRMRVWERGSGETWACGTGACAVAVAAVENGYCKKNEDITVKLKGGDLVIKYTDDTVFLTGNAETVFEGEVEL